jgi:hypothetical protein
VIKFQRLYNLVFSDKRSDRWKRHFLFWFAVFLYHLVRIGIMYPPDNLLANLPSLLKMTLYHGVLSNIFFSYGVVYILVPYFFKKRRYVEFVLGLIVCFALLQVLTIVHNVLQLNKTAGAVIGTIRDNSVILRPGIIRAFGNPPLICALLLSLKTLKNWHVEELKTETLATENTNAELQLLKAQVHPHFLFNTLNNIYSFALVQSPQAGVLVQRLSDMLRYMIHECEQPLVSLEKEIKQIHDYVGLERVRYGNRLDMEIDIRGDCNHKMIAPLLMIPFVENSFKHGASIMLGKKWIKLVIDIDGSVLHFFLSNSRPVQQHPQKGNNGIGLINVSKRLELLYPGKHQLLIESTEDSYTVHLTLVIQTDHPAVPAINIKNHSTSYA